MSHGPVKLKSANPYGHHSIQPNWRALCKEGVYKFHCDFSSCLEISTEIRHPDSCWVKNCPHTFLSTSGGTKPQTKVPPSPLQWWEHTAASPKILHHTEWRTWLLKVSQMKGDYLKTISDISRFEKVGRMYFLNLRKEKSSKYQMCQWVGGSLPYS